jgi:alpha-L-fucosidase
MKLIPALSLSRLSSLFLAQFLFAAVPGHSASPVVNQSMDKMWGDSTVKVGDVLSDRVALFRDGNYGMFIHWGLYSSLGGQWKDHTFYGIGEWIKRQMEIPAPEYMDLAKDFNPVDFDAKAIAQLAKDAGMKWIIITSKHHEGFAMFKSAHPFNIVDASPFNRDPMKELAAACQELGLGFGFYYSHNQDWTEPGGTNGPKTNPDGTPATIEQYFREKCLPQVKEICENYGPLSYIWFDTPGDMPEPLVKELADYVRQAQPSALLCSRIGYGLGDYSSKGDMDVPVRNAEGLWETCDTTNDSWSYAWYDQNWKDGGEILFRVVSTVARGGTYLLNVGPDGAGRVPDMAAKYLRRAGDWIKRYPQVIYNAGASPWEHALPWGEVTTQGNTLNLVVFDWPQDGRLMLPGLQSTIKSAGVLVGDKLHPVEWVRRGSWTELTVPSAPVDSLATVVQVVLNDAPLADQALGVFPNITSTLRVEFADVKNAEKKDIRWMEKFGEWKHLNQVSKWSPEGLATWTINVAQPGDYQVELTYKGEGGLAEEFDWRSGVNFDDSGRLVWKVKTDEGAVIQNQQNSSKVYQTYPIGTLTFATAGTHTIAVSFVDGNGDKASLAAVRLTKAK